MKAMVSTEYKKSLKDLKKTMLVYLLPKFHDSVRMFPR